MDPADPGHRALTPLSYHATVVDHLRRHEADVWRAASEGAGNQAKYASQRESLRAMLLRDTYRIERDAHADVHAALGSAMARLGIDAPATLYQAPGENMNAMLVYVPGEVHILVQGPLLHRLSQDELLAVFGHELAHYALWSRDGAQFLVADGILNDAAASPAGRQSHHETYRRYALHTELFADRGSAMAAGSLEPAISALVKIQTGIATVDAAAYLRQAAEVEANEARASAAHSHPETFIRARALSLWWERSPGVDAWIDTRLNGPLSLARLDLAEQVRLQQMTRGFLAHYLAGTALASEPVLAQVRLLFPDWTDGEAELGPASFGAEVADASVREYLNALMIDLALADPDQQDAALLRAGRLARELGSYDALLVNLRRDAGMGKRELDRYARQLDKEALA